MRKKVLVVVGTRPNFIKVTQFRKVAQMYDQFDLKILHTGQHYDHKMSSVFFEQFDLRPDDIFDLKSKTPASQIAEIITKLEEYCLEFKPDLIMVPGDVNSTLATAICANKLNIKLAHIESGLRSFDNEMPEENNRILTDLISDYLLVTEQSGLDNLSNEKKSKNKIHFVGNTMIDTIVAFTDKIDSSEILARLELEEKKFVLLTMHRPSNVDNEEGLLKLCKTIEGITKHFKIVFPIHPRTLNRAAEFGLVDRLTNNPKLVITDPLDYFSFQKLIKTSFLVLTDSGGIQEETTFYQVPCLTARNNTERPSTITEGTNELIKFEPDLILTKLKDAINGNIKSGKIPQYWDGQATKRIFEVLNKTL